MPYQIVYSENPLGVVTTFSGIITDENLIQSCIDRALEEDILKDLIYIMDDFSSVSEFKVTSEGVKKCAEVSVAASMLNNKIIHVAIMPSDLLYGMARMWQAYIDETGWTSNIVRSREDAEQWLQELGCLI